MRRRFIDTAPPAIELDLDADEAARILASIASFLAATPHNNKTLCEALQHAVEARIVQWNEVEHLSVWCHTDQPPRGVSEHACELARELLGVVPGRMLDIGGKKSADYDNIAKSIRARAAEDRG